MSSISIALSMTYIALYSEYVYYIREFKSALYSSKGHYSLEYKYTVVSDTSTIVLQYSRNLYCDL